MTKVRSLSRSLVAKQRATSKAVLRGSIWRRAYQLIASSYIGQLASASMLPCGMYVSKNVTPENSQIVCNKTVHFQPAPMNVVCSICDKVDLDAIFQHKEPRAATPEFNLGTLDSICARAMSCPLCRAIVAYINEHHQQDLASIPGLKSCYLRSAP
jgi:hypothetical protein